MDISPDTPLSEIPGFESISVRAQNVCRSGRLRTIGQLAKLSDSDLLRLPNCGRKTVMELRSLHMPVAVPEHRQQLRSTDAVLRVAYADAAKACGRDVMRVLTPLTATVGSEEYFIKTAISNPAEIFRKLSLPEFIHEVELRGALGVFLSTLANQEMFSDDESEALASAAEMLKAKLPDFAMVDAFYAQPSAVRSCIGYFYHTHFERLSVRSQNAFKDFYDISDLIPFIYGFFEYDPRSHRNCGRKSSEELARFVKDIKALMTRLLTTLTAGTEDDALDVLAVRYTQIYDFLSVEEGRRLARFVMQTDTLPAIYLVERYISKSANNDARVFKGLYGISCRRRSMSSLSRELGLSRERIRQLGMSQMSLPPVLEPLRDELLGIMKANVISSASPLWPELAASNLLDNNPESLMGIVRAMSRNLDVIRLTGGRHSFLIDRRLLHGVSLPQCVGEITRMVRMRRCEPETVSVPEILRRFRASIARHADVDDLSVIVTDHFVGTPGVTVVDGHTLRLEPNSINRRLAITRIIEEYGEPMTIEDMFAEFNRRYPDYAIRSITAMRAFVFQCRNIMSVGKSGRYVLDTWTDRFHVTILQYVTSLVENSDIPVSLDEIERKTREIFPRTTSNSIATIISLDPNKRLTRFARGYFGVTGRSYPGWEDCMRSAMRRLPFKQRFEQFREYVANKGEMPTSSSSDEEGVTLRRWLSNVLAGRIMAKPEEVESLRQYLHETRRVPQGADEVRFKRSCDALLEYVSETGTMPTMATNRRLYQWYHLSMRARGVWKDNRNEYFEELLSALVALGISI